MRFRFRGRGRPTASEINRWNKLANQQARGELRRVSAVASRPYDPSSRVGIVRNTSGADRLAFDCLSIDGLAWELETDGTADVVFNLVTTDPDKAPAVLIEPIEDDGYGLAILDGLAIAKVGGGTGLVGVVDPTNHRIKPEAGGSIKLLAAPHATNLKILPVVLNAGLGTGEVHYLFTLTTTITAGTGTATIRNLEDTAEIEAGQTLIGPLGHFNGMVSGKRGVCIKRGDDYYALTPWVTSVRWDSPDLEYSRDAGATWINIDTAEACP